jgi:polyhydroxybutyrate depolymerase
MFIVESRNEPDSSKYIHNKKSILSGALCHGDKKILNLSMKRKLLISLLFLNILFANAQVTVIDSIISGGVYRNYRLYVPAAYNGLTAWPLIFNIHGYTSNASQQQLYTNFGPIADTAHFLMVYPNATVYNGQPTWNSGFGMSVDDVGFISDLIDSLSATYNIDQNAVYSCGMSNGGFMSHTLACALSNKITAIASVTGSMTYYQKGTCAPEHPVPVMQIHGTADGTVPYAGNTYYLPIDTLVKYWAINNSCNPTPVYNAVPNINTSDNCTADHYVYNGGTYGSSVELYRINNGGHTWPYTYPIGVTNQDFNASEKIWLFFRKYRLNQLVGINELSKESMVSIYPNPATEMLIIEAGGFVCVRIIDINGRDVLTSDKKQIDISALSKGIYSIVIETVNGRAVKKLVKI